MEKYSLSVKTVVNGDEYYSPQNVVDMIVPHILKSGYRKIWCPFDTAESNFVKTFQSLGYDVSYGHIDTGQDFFNCDKPQGEIVVSNPPFSKRDAILKKMYDMQMPFALVINFNGLFDSKARRSIFEENGVQLLIPHGRMKFYCKGKGLLNSPNFQSVYVCNKLLDGQIVFSNSHF